MMTIGGIGFFELLLLAVVASGVFLIARFTSRRWLWSCGLVGCVAVAAVNTPADPLSTVIVAVQFCGLYVLSAFAWHNRGEVARPADTA